MVLTSLKQLLLTVSSMDDKPEMTKQTYAVLSQPPAFPQCFSPNGGCMDQTGLCPVRATQAAFLGEERSLSA